MSSKTTKFKAKDSSKVDKLVSSIPISAFVAKKIPLTVFEALVSYLKDVRGLKYRQIAILLNRDERNIWTVYNRAKKKREKFGKNI